MPQASAALREFVLAKARLGCKPIFSLVAGGYTTWGKGVAVVKKEGSATSHELEFEYKFYDRYNWDAGKKVTFAGITVTDKFMGEFHRQGLAREFDCVGSFKRKFTWKK